MLAASSFVDELAVRIRFAKGSPTMLFVVADDHESLEETKRVILGLLRGCGLTVADIGLPGRWTKVRASLEMPHNWVIATQVTIADAYALDLAPDYAAMARLHAQRVNGQRTELSRLDGPLLLFMSGSTELSLRESAMDFYTWGTPYLAPSLGDLAALLAAKSAN